MNDNSQKNEHVSPDVIAEPKISPEQEHAKAMSALGASKGGKARANVLTPAQRSSIAREAVKARWIKAGKLKEIEATPNDFDDGNEKPQESSAIPYSMFRGKVKLGNVELDCHVLNDGRRVFTQGEVVRALTWGPDNRGRDSSDLARYLSANPLIAQDFAGGPIRFQIPKNPQVAVGLEATLLIEICDKYLQAMDEKLLRPSQYKLAVQSGIIVRASAKVGIIALIDEATGYQTIRKKHDLQIKFQAFIADELQEWARMFKDEFWFELARLEGIHYSPRSRPLRWGKYVMMFVYDAIDGDVGKELRKKNPGPRFLKNHHQWLKRFGRDKVHDQIERVITIMKLCNNMDDFREKFAKVFKKTPLQLSFDDLSWQAS
jgi:hypothetical protein